VGGGVLFTTTQLRVVRVCQWRCSYVYLM